MTIAPPGIGSPTQVTPPASVPLGFLTAAGLGLVGFGFVTWFAADRLVVSPAHPGVVSAVHLGVLAFLTTAVLGALHQFGPVVGRRPIRSVAIARVSLVTMVLAGWLLPNGFAHGPEWVILAGGLSGAVTVVVVAWNLSAPLSSRSGGVPVIGLRISLAYLLLTVAFGVVYVLNRRAAWFPLLPNRVLAHAHLGLLGWLGLTYVSVAEKLWPMFLLSHRPSARSGAVAVAAIGGGVLPLALGLLIPWPPMAVVGGGLVVVGLGAHIISLASSVRHRRRPLELLHGYLFTSSVFLVAGTAFGLLAAVSDVTSVTRASMVAAEVAALMAWLALALVGHCHKVVPFIVYSRLRSRGVRTHRSGRPLLFGDLYLRGLGMGRSRRPGRRVRSSPVRDRRGLGPNGCRWWRPHRRGWTHHGAQPRHRPEACRHRRPLIAHRSCCQLTGKGRSMTELPTDPIRAEHRALIPHLDHVESAAIRVTGWDATEAGRILPRIVNFLRDDLIPHAAVEEELLYPAVDRLVGANVTATMTVDHVVIGERIEALAAAMDRALGHWEDRDLVDDLSRQLASIAAIVSLHFRKEEEVLLPILDAGMSVTEGHQLFERMGHDSHGHSHA